VKQAAPKKDDIKSGKGSKKWWVLALASVAGFALYHHLKNAKK
jgi:hypothetical protein